MTLLPSECFKEPVYSTANLFDKICSILLPCVCDTSYANWSLLKKKIGSNSQQMSKVLPRPAGSWRQAEAKEGNSLPSSSPLALEP